MAITIYYLDDEPALCSNFAELFGEPGVDIETFQEPQSLIDRCKEQVPDLLFMDFRLPRTTGEEVAGLLDPKIPKILVTGDMEVKSKYPFEMILEKPVKEKVFLELIDRYSK